MSRPKKNAVKVTYADGRTEFKRPGDFRGIPTNRRARLAYYRRQPHWRKIRKEALMRDGYACVTCGSISNLHVHHLTYKHIGEERLHELRTLCENCHAAEHRRWMKERGEGWESLRGI